MESSSSDRRDGSEESRSGGGRDRPGRCSQRAARPSTPPRRPIPASVSPRRSPRLTKSAVQGLRSLPLTTKGGRRTAHSRSVSGDERGQGPSRSSLSSSDHGRSSRGRRSQSREPTPPQLRNFARAILPWCPIPRTHLRSPASTISSRDGCGWSALTPEIGSEAYRVTMTRRRSAE